MQTKDLQYKSQLKYLCVWHFNDSGSKDILRGGISMTMESKQIVGILITVEVKRQYFDRIMMTVEAERWDVEC